MVRESMVTICQGMHSNLGDLPLILFFYVFPKKIIIFNHMHRLKKIYIYREKGKWCLFPYSGKSEYIIEIPKQKTISFPRD